MVWVDHPFFPTSQETTADFLYIRWQGNRKKINGTTGKTEIDQSEQIKKWANKIVNNKDKVKQIFGYFSKYFSGNPINDSKEINKLTK